MNYHGRDFLYFSSVLSISNIQQNYVFAVYVLPFFELYKNVCTVKMNDVPEVMSLCKEAELYRNFY